MFPRFILGFNLLYKLKNEVILDIRGVWLLQDLIQKGNFWGELDVLYILAALFGVQRGTSMFAVLQLRRILKVELPSPWNSSMPSMKKVILLISLLNVKWQANFSQLQGFQLIDFPILVMDQSFKDEKQTHQLNIRRNFFWSLLFGLDCRIFNKKMHETLTFIDSITFLTLSWSRLPPFCNYNLTTLTAQQTLVITP